MDEYELRTKEYEKQFNRGEINGNELDVLLDQLHGEYFDE